MNFRFFTLPILLLVFGKISFGQTNVLSKGGPHSDKIKVETKAVQYYGDEIFLRNTTSDITLRVEVTERCYKCQGNCSGATYCDSDYSKNPMKNPETFTIHPGQRVYIGHESCCYSPSWSAISFFEYHYKVVSWIIASNPNSPSSFTNYSDGSVNIKVAGGEQYLGLDLKDTTLNLYMKKFIPDDIITEFLINTRNNKINLAFKKDTKEYSLTWDKPRRAPSRSPDDHRPYIVKNKKYSLELKTFINPPRTDRFSVIFNTSKIDVNGTDHDILHLMYPSPDNRISFEESIRLDQNGNYSPPLNQNTISEPKLTYEWKLEKSDPNLNKGNNTTVVEICACRGWGGVNGLLFWGPADQPCNGIPGWKNYNYRKICRQTNLLGRCKGKGGGVLGVWTWGPIGEKCYGIDGWEYYGEDNLVVDITKTGVNPELNLCACKGKGNILNHMDLWGPRGQKCGGLWNDTYKFYCGSQISLKSLKTY